MKKRVLLALLVSAMTLTAMPGVTFAGSNADSADNGGLSYEGYTQVWGDEFNGDSLNRDDWNVETHKKGWVNSELQEYVDSEENIQVKDGKLLINPVKKVTSVENNEEINLIKNADFSSEMEGWTETIANWGGSDGSADAQRTTSDGKIIYNIKTFLYVIAFDSQGKKTVKCVLDPVDFYPVSCRFQFSSICLSLIS